MKLRGSALSWMRALVRNLSAGSRRDAELRADIEAYVDALTDEKIAAGYTPEAARREARLEAGGLNSVTEETRSVRAGALLSQMSQDARYALRMFRRDPGFSVAAILTLALGIGAATTMFSVVDAVLLEPLPYSDPDRLVLVWERNIAIGKERDLVAPANYQDWRRENTTLENLGAYRFRTLDLTGVQDPEQLTVLALTQSVFKVLRADAAIGRVFTEREELGRERVVVLAHQLWQRRFGGDPNVVGRSVTLDGGAFTIVGVMPAQFTFPEGNPVDFYSPLVFSRDELTRRRSHLLTVIGRLKETASVETAAMDLGTIARRIAAEDSTTNPEIAIVRAHDALVEDVRLGLWILFAMVGFVLLIACANVGSLLLVRATVRTREIAMRAALGAGRGRLLRQLLTESVLLALIGSAAGTVLAWWLLGGLVQSRLVDLPRIQTLGIDGSVLLFAAAAALAAGMAFGIVPALFGRSADINFATRSVTASAPARGGARSALLVLEVAVSLVLLTGAGLMVRSFMKVQSLDLGFSPESLMTAQVRLPAAKYRVDPLQFQAVPAGTILRDTKPTLFFTQLQQQLDTMPGIESAGAVSALPLNPVGTDYDMPVIVEGKPRPPAGEEPQADFRTATTGYFKAMRIPLLRGRGFNDLDGPGSTPVIVINDTLAREMFPGEDPIGQRIILYGRPREIVGVIGSVRHNGFIREPRPEMIVPYRQFQFAGMTLVVRSALHEAAVAGAITQAVRQLDPQQPVYRLLPMDRFLSDSMARPRFTTLLLAGFAALGLILALVGVYGVTSYAVHRRGREIAVRMALGAQRREVVRMAATESFRYALLGIGIGLAGAAAGTRFLSGLLFGVAPTDAAVFLTATAALALTTLAASCIPAFRAARVEPTTALRSE